MSDAVASNIAIVTVDRHCWVCFATEEDEPGIPWIQPCACKGSSKWVHQKCLQRWVDEKQKGNASSSVSCPQCNTTYIIVYPEMGPLVLILDSINSVLYRICPFLAAGLVVGSVYWVAVTYGAVTVMQVMGPDQGQEFLEMSDPLFLLVTLPTIPTALVIGKLIKWEDAVLIFLRRNVQKLPLLKYIFPGFVLSADGADDVTAYTPPPPLPDSVCATRILCSALVFPTMATIVGNVFFRSVKPQVHRAALGAISFLIFKGAFKLYYRQKQYTRQRQRKILDFHQDQEVAVPSPTIDNADVP